MTNTYSISQDEDWTELEIAPAAIAMPSNPQINRAEYWNLNATAFGTAAFQPAWQFATGKGIVISIVDEGVNATHLDLVGSFDASLSYDPREIAGAGAFSHDPANAHGTAVAGIIAGAADNAIGTIGAAPGATITSSYLRYGSGFQLSDLGAIMAHQASYDVSNNSWGFTSAFGDNFSKAYFADLAAGMETAASTGRGGLGTVLVFSAGNGKLVSGGENIGDDANFHNLGNSRFGIAVGAHDKTGEAAFFSNPGTNVLVSAPGVAIRTTSGTSAGASDSTLVSGTSFAAPMVSAAVALMLEVNPNLGYRDIQEILAISADPSRSGTTLTNGATNVNGGGLVFDREMGFGALNAASAVALAQSWTRQSTAANEEHISVRFDLPAEADPLFQEIAIEVMNSGTAGFSLDFVELSLDIQDANIRNLRIELISPDGTVALIAPNLRAAGNITALDFTFSSVATWGETPYGLWTVRLSHSTGSAPFTILDASLDLYGDTVTADGEYYFTASFARLVAANSARATIIDTDGGIDRLNFAAAASAVVADLTARGGAIGKTGFTLDGEFENIYGSIHADRFTGSAGSNAISGGFGNDWINGMAGDDFLEGGAGDDTLIGGEGADSLDGGDGIDTVLYERAVTLDFVTGNHTGDAEGDVFIRIERFALSSGNDAFYGSLAAVDDYVMGNGGDDLLDGGAGNDTLIGGAGADTLIGGTGDDTFIIDSFLDVLVEYAGEGIDTVHAPFSFTLAENFENLVLLGTARTGRGNAASNELTGNGKANVLYGYDGDDLLVGLGGKDKLYGGNGSDTLVGGNGKDLLVGGQGADVFVFNSKSEANKDRIKDFKPGLDIIDLSGIDANSRKAGNDVFSFIGTKGFTKAGQLAIEYSGNKTIVMGDLNGDRKADFKIILDGHLKLTADDFIL